MKLKWIIKTTAIALIIAVAILGLAGHDSIVAAQDESSKIEATLVDRFTTDGSADFIVRFTEQADLSTAYSMDWTARGEFVYNSLVETANRSQVNAKAILDTAGLRYQTMIGGNDLYVWNGSFNNASAIAALPEVNFIRATRVWQLDPYTVTNPIGNVKWAGDLLAYNLLTTAGNTPQATTDWGITDSKADQFWAAYGVQGAGIKVANIDTGVQYNHPALIGAYACAGDPGNPACWEDPSNVCGGTPCDNQGHGTHTMGTMVANDDPALTYIAGMAPDATWIACLGCDSGNGCSDFALTTCGSWLVAPNGDPANRPNVVNNSWGGTPDGDPWYLTYVNNWRAAGIFPAFSAGNSGPTCNSMGDPGSYQESFASAAHSSNRAIAGFSSRGDSAFGHIPYTKPNISAPGVSICSTVPGSGWNCGYSGTSMASPHNAGAVALLWSCNPALIGQIDATFQLLQNTSNAPPAGDCGAPGGQPGNYTFGYGYLDVLAAGQASCGSIEFGAIDGHVLDQDGGPIEGASVTASPGKADNEILATTDPTGYYTMTLPAGTYNVTASKVNYTSQTANGVVVTGGATTIQDFTLNFLGGWTQIALPAGCPDWTRFDGEYFAGTGLVYFLGGRGGASGGDTFGDVFSFNPADHTCADTGANMPTPVSNYSIAPANNGAADLLCIFGGRPAAGGVTPAVQCYDPVANTASQVTTLPGDLATFVPGGIIAIDGKVVVYGGFQNIAPPYETNTTYEWDPVANSWTQKGNLPLGMGYIQSAVVDGKIYGFGGTVFDGTNLVSQVKTAVYDPIAGTWNDAAVAELPTAGAEGRAYGFDTNSGLDQAGKVIVAGGGLWPADTNEVFSYDVAANTYDYAFPNLNVTRRDQAGFYVPGNPGAMWVFGGRSGADTPPYGVPEYLPVNVTTLAPQIVITPPALEASLLPDASVVVPMTVGNEGNADLTWQLFAGASGPSWSDNFDSYEVGSAVHGQGGWKGWGNVPAATGYVSDVQSHSPLNSVAIELGSDLVHEYTGYTSGKWTYTAWQYIPTDFSGQTYFILLNQYDDAGVNLNWSLEVLFDSATGLLTNDGPDGGTLPMLKEQWVELRVEIDLDANTQSFFYGDDLLFTGSWTEGMSGGGILNINAVDLFANGASVVYYDDISLIPTANPACPVALPWLSFNPADGTTLPGDATPVDATFDSTGLGVGEYSGTVCAASNDPNTPLVGIPVTMTVLAQADLGITKADSPDPVQVGGNLTYTLTVTNHGPQTATGVTVVDNLPVGVSFVSASAGCVELDGVVTCSVADLPVDGVVEITIVVTADVEGVITNTATVSGLEVDPNPENNTATQETTVNPAGPTIFDFYLPLVMKG
jgi:uncharacterized repeat protein (TIGR01451 family)